MSRLRLTSVAAILALLLTILMPKLHFGMQKQLELLCAENSNSMIDTNLTINTDLAREILTGFVKTEVTRTGLSRAVIGLSGGIDSALSCILAVEALGKDNVLAVRMPYKASSKDSLDHAQLLIDQLGIPSKTIEITDMVEPLFKLDSEMSNMRKGNIMARERMIVLYDQSEVFKGLVIGTRADCIDEEKSGRI